MRLKILTPTRLEIDKEVDSVTLPGSLGQMTILPMHAALLATLKRGELRYKIGEQRFGGNTIDGGFVEVLKNQILVMTPSWQTAPTSVSGRVSH